MHYKPINYIDLIPYIYISEKTPQKETDLKKAYGGLGKVKYAEVFGVFPDAANVGLE